MAQEERDMVVRRSVRHDIALRAGVVIAGTHAGVVRFSSGAGGPDGRIGVDVVDVSTGGVGVMSPVFIPRKTLLTLAVYGLTPDSPPITTVMCRVQRVTMTDARPAYLLGLAFERMSNVTTAQVDAL